MIRIHSKYMAGWLLYHGHQLIEIQRNDEKPQFNVFIFNATESLRRDMERYKKPEGGAL